MQGLKKHHLSYNHPRSLARPSSLPPLYPVSITALLIYREHLSQQLPIPSFIQTVQMIARPRNGWRSYDLSGRIIESSLSHAFGEVCECVRPDAHKQVGCRLHVGRSFGAAVDFQCEVIFGVR